MVEQTQWFVRFYGRILDNLWKSLSGPDRPVTEVQVMFELAELGETTATDLCEALRLDAGYLSRTLAALQRKGLVRRRRSSEDARMRPVSLTASGEAAFARLDERYRQQIRALLYDIGEADRRRLVAALATIKDVMERTSMDCARQARL